MTDIGFVPLANYVFIAFSVVGFVLTIPKGLKYSGTFAVMLSIGIMSLVMVSGLPKKIVSFGEVVASGDIRESRDNIVGSDRLVLSGVAISASSNFPFVVGDSVELRKVVVAPSGEPYYFGSSAYFAMCNEDVGCEIISPGRINLLGQRTGDR